MLDNLLLVACILIVIVTVTYIFYWNRVFGYSLSFLVRLVTWTQSSSAVWIDFGEQRGRVHLFGTKLCPICVGSVHLSLLAGRILFRNVRYHSSNQTVRIVNCQVSWRYWIRRPAEEEDLADDGIDGEDVSGKRTHASDLLINSSYICREIQPSQPPLSDPRFDGGCRVVYIQ